MEKSKRQPRETVALIVDRLKLAGIKVDVTPEKNYHGMALAHLVVSHGDVKDILVTIEANVGNGCYGMRTDRIYHGMQYQLHGFWSEVGKTKNVFFRLRKDGTFALDRFAEAVKTEIKAVTVFRSNSIIKESKEKIAEQIVAKLKKEFPEAGRYICPRGQSIVERNPLFEICIDNICEEKLRKILPAIEAMLNPTNLMPIIVKGFHLLGFTDSQRMSELEQSLFSVATTPPMVGQP